MNFQFSILRLCISLALVGIAFALFGNQGTMGVWIASIVAVMLVVIAMTAGLEDYASIFRLVTLAAIGGMIGYLLGPTITGDDRFTPSEEIQSIQNAIWSAAFGSFGGWVWNLSIRSKATKSRSE